MSLSSRLNNKSTRSQFDEVIMYQHIDEAEAFVDFATKALQSLRNADFNKQRSLVHEIDVCRHRIIRGESAVVVKAEFKKLIK